MTKPDTLISNKAFNRMTALTHIFILRNILSYQSGLPEKTINRPKMIVLRKDMRVNRGHLKMSLILYLSPISLEFITSPVVLN